MLCDANALWGYADSRHVFDICNDILAAENAEDRQKIKKKLPIVTWQAYFEGRRLNHEAQASGLFMLDIDHMDVQPYEFYEKHIAGRHEELGIMVVHMTPSCAGLRVVAKCRKEFTTLEQCQRWLAEKIGTEFDEACKDMARSSYLPASSYFFYFNGNVFTDEPEEGTLYQNNVDDALDTLGFIGQRAKEAHENQKKNTENDQREGLFGGLTEYQGVPLTDIAEEWLNENGGPVVEGERNTRLYQVALRMRYITDFNMATMLKSIPNYGLSTEEMKTLCAHAISAQRRERIPDDLLNVVDKLKSIKDLNADDDELPDIITDTTKLPPLPPIFQQWVEVAPEDFKSAVILAQLPILGALGSRLRSVYLDGQVHSPSFIVSLEAPQASGKSFLRRVTEYELAQMIEHDNLERAREREYEERIKELKMLNVKVNKKDKEEVLGTKPETLIRYLPATISITKLLMRVYAAKELHCFALAEEIDTMTKAYKRGFSDLSDLLRVSFDNGLFGQDYATDTSFSGTVRLYYNLLNSGTPKALRRFYRDPEDGLISRVLFVQLPDQFGKTMPVWQDFDKDQKRIVDINLVRLNEISLQGDEVMPEHHMKMAFLNAELKKWLAAQQQEALRENNRTRDIFCRRSAVVGFRAGMIAWFLYGEKNTPTYRKKVTAFATWVANSMLNQLIMRFDMKETGSNTIPWESTFTRLPETFSATLAARELSRAGCSSQISHVLYKWKLNGLIEQTQKKDKNAGKEAMFKKVASKI